MIYVTGQRLLTSMKIIVLGNAGAGKSTMAKQLMGDRAIAHLSLDEIAWDAEVQRKPLAESMTLLQTFILLLRETPDHSEAWRGRDRSGKRGVRCP